MTAGFQDVRGAGGGARQLAITFERPLDGAKIDAIAGATITSRAVGKGINEAAQVLLPRLVPNLEKIRSKP